jgi:cbb3-type cytochrome oxidase subunit 3
MSLMPMLRRSGLVVLTLFFIAVFSAFAWSDETARSFRAAVSSDGGLP